MTKRTASDAKRSAERIDISPATANEGAQRGNADARRIRFCNQQGDKPVNLTNLQMIMTLFGAFFGPVSLLTDRLPQIGLLRKAIAASAARRRQQAMTTSGPTEQSHRGANSP
jgi:hypothetical protein